MKITQYTAVGISADIFRQFASLSLARHGNSPRIPGIAELDPQNRVRPLGEKGRHQASLTRNKLANRKYDLVAASPLTRAQETTTIITGKTQVTVLPALDIDDDMENPLNIMFKDLMYSPLKKYFAHPLDDHLKSWAFDAFLQILDKTNDVVAEGADVFIGGHAVCQPAIAWIVGVVVGGESGTALQNAMLELDPGLGEAEVIVITFANGVVKHEIIAP